MPTSLEQLTHSPQDILADRSLFVPQEPQDADAVLCFWEGISRETGGERRLAHSVEMTLDRFVRDAQRADAVDLEEILGFDALEWYIHQKAPEIAADEYVYRWSHGCIANSFWDVLINKKVSDNIAAGIGDAVAPVLVIPEAVDGLLSRLNSEINYREIAVRPTVIGNVKGFFAERVEPNVNVTLFGDAGDFVAAYAGRVYGERGKPTVTIHGNVARAAGHCASSLLLHVEGDAQDELGVHVGGFRGPKESVLIRVDGSGGTNIGRDARGSFQISCGSYVSVGKTNGANPDSHIEVGPNPPGKGNQVIEAIDERYVPTPRHPRRHQWQ